MLQLAITRIAALVQIPILAGAVFIVHRQDGLFALGQSLEFSALVLFLLCIVAIRARENSRSITWSSTSTGMSRSTKVF